MTKSIVWISDVPWANSGMGIQSRIVIDYLTRICKCKITYLAWYVGRPNEITQYKINDITVPVYFLGEKSFGETEYISAILDKIKPDILISFGDLHMIKALLDIDAEYKKKWIHWWTADTHRVPDMSLAILNRIPRLAATTEFGAKTILKFTGRQVPIVGHTYQTPLTGRNPQRDEIRKEFDIALDDVIIGCVARNIWRKNLHTLLNSFAVAAKSCPKLKLLIHTDLLGFQEGGCDIKQTVQTLNISKRVMATSEDIDLDAMGKVFDIMDFHAITSFGEGFCVPVIESMARGVPNIVPNHTTLPELVHNSGYIVPLSISGSIHPLNNMEFFGPCPQKLAKAMIQAYQDKTKNEENYLALSNRAVNRAKDYSPSQILRSWDKLISDFETLPAIDVSQQPLICHKNTFEISKPKALLCSMFYPPSIYGGGEYTAHELMKGLLSYGWDVRVLTLFAGLEGNRGDPLPEQELIIDDVKILRSGNYWYENLMYILEHDPPDVLITYEIYSWYSLRFLRCAKQYNIKTAVYEQYWRYLSADYNNISEQPPCPPPQGLEATKLVDVFIVNSIFSKNMFKKHLGIESEVVYPPMTFLASKKLQDFGEFITMIAPSKAKGVDTVFYLAEHLPNEKFKLVGAIGEDETYINMKKYPNIAYQSQTDDMDAVYKDAKVVLFPSKLDESFGRVPVEAMSYGLPVIARGVGAVPGVVEKYATVIDKKANDDAWLKAIKKIIDNPKTAKKIGAQSHNFVAKKFKTAKQCKIFSDILKKLVSGSPSIYIPESAQIISVCDSGFFSVDSALRMTEYYYGDKIKHYTLFAHTGKDQLIDVLQYLDINDAKVIIYGAWSNSYTYLIKKLKLLRPQVKHIINWHSPLAQIEMGNDVKAFSICNEMLNRQEIDYVLVPFEPDAKLFRNSYHPNYRWFPDTISEIHCQPCLDADDGIFKVGFFALPSARKNILSQFSAMRLLHLTLRDLKNSSWKGVKLFVGNGFDRYKDYFQFLQMLNIPYEILPHLANKQVYYNHLGAMNLNIQITFSEAFNYVCAESLALGVPCLGSLMTPALISPIKEIQDILNKFLIVNQIDDTIAIFNKMRLFTSMPQNLASEITETWKTHIRVLAQHHNTAIKTVLDEIYEKYAL